MLVSTGNTNLRDITLSQLADTFDQVIIGLLSSNIHIYIIMDMNEYQKVSTKLKTVRD